ncbi:MAG TPA: hypothetical protein DCZ94_17175 [Lentisphaeria bacterium]|nr:hypothetical protein [Lentisphaeria bacterium]
MKHCLMICVVLAITAYSLSAAEPVKDSAYRWQSVSIGGGGYVTGLVIHPKVADLVYIRTDVGGFYRWNPHDGSCMPLIDHFRTEQSSYFGGESLAIDPGNPDILYIAAGMYLNSKGAIFKSDDRGQTWNKLTLETPMNGNGPLRSGGERLVVSPHDSNILLFGSRNEGLFRSQDAGTTWSKIDAFPGNLTVKEGIECISFDTRTAGLVYACAFRDAVYRSADAGLTWTKLEGSPAQVLRMDIAGDGTLFTVGSTGVFRFREGVWKDLTPTGEHRSYGSITVDPKDPKHVAICYAGFNKNPNLDQPRGLYESKDGGDTWTSKICSPESTVPWHSPRNMAMSASSLTFDPHHPGRAWLTDFFSVWKTDGFTQERPVWKNYSKNHEEVVPFSLTSPPAGAPLLSAVADVGGFRHDSLDEFPSEMLGKWGSANWDQYTYQIAYCETKPLELARAGGNHWNGVWGGSISHDGGKTWQRYKSFPKNVVPLRIAMSATDPNKIVMAIQNGQAIRTKDGGTTWEQVTGLPKGPSDQWKWCLPLAADNVDGDVFYYVADGKLYRSNDGGASFTLVSGKSPTFYTDPNWTQLRTVPGKKGEIWVSGLNGGLARSTDGGETFSRLTQFKQVRLFAFGAPAAAGEPAALYVYGAFFHGKFADKPGIGIYRSLDLGKTWQDIQDPKVAVGDSPCCMEASRQTFGLVFIGTNGRGIFYGAQAGSSK